MGPGFRVGPPTPQGSHPAEWHERPSWQLQRPRPAWLAGDRMTVDEFALLEDEARDAGHNVQEDAPVALAGHIAAFLDGT